jgi:hypothetical protein
MVAVIRVEFIYIRFTLEMPKSAAPDPIPAPSTAVRLNVPEFIIIFSIFEEHVPVPIAAALDPALAIYCPASNISESIVELPKLPEPAPIALAPVLPVIE